MSSLDYTTLNVGQKWIFEGNDLMTKSYLIIRKLETNERGIDVVHLTVKDIRINNQLWDIDHLPIEKTKLLESLVSQINTTSEYDSISDFNSAYDVWKMDKGGVWNIELRDVIINTLKNSGII